MLNLIFKLDPQLGTSLQGQVREMIVSAILNRSLQPGDRLVGLNILPKQY